LGQLASVDPFKNCAFDFFQLVGDTINQREYIIDEFGDDQIADEVHSACAASRIAGRALPHRIQARHRLAMNRDQIPITKESVEFDGLDTVSSLLGDAHRVCHEEQVISVFVDLCPLVRSGAVFDRERMKPEALPQKLKTGFVGRLKVDPAHLAVTRRQSAIVTFENFQTRALD
jgi:hypothetical protein